MDMSEPRAVNPMLDQLTRQEVSEENPKKHRVRVQIVNKSNRFSKLIDTNIKNTY